MGLKSAASSFKLVNQLKALKRTLVVVYLPWIWILLVAGLQNNVPVKYLMRDPVGVAHQPFYYGVFSQIGVLIWCTCAAICFFCAALLRKTKKHQIVWFWIAWGALTLALLVDDLLLIHEVVLPQYLGLSGETVYFVYLSLIVFYLIKFYKIILNTDYIFLLLAFLLFGVSILVDQVVDYQSNFIYSELQERKSIHLLEDGSKLLGIVSWCTYFSRVCFTTVKQLIR